MPYQSQTPSGRWGYETETTNTSGSGRNSPNLFSMPPTSPISGTHPLPTSRGWCWEHHELTPRYYAPDYRSKQGPYHFQPPLDPASVTQPDPQIPGPQRIPTPIPRMILSPLPDSDSSKGSATPSLTPTSRKGVLPTPSMPTDLTTSGMSSSKSTETSLVPIKLKPESSGGPTSRPEPTGDTPPQGRRWSSSLLSTEEIPSLGDTTMQRSQHKYMPTGTGAFTHPPQGSHALIYGPKPTRSRAFYNTNFSNWCDYKETTLTWTVPPRNPYEEFQHDKAMFGRDFQPSQYAEDVPDFYVVPPFQLPDSPPNPRHPGYYTGPRSSRLVVGASPDSRSRMQEDLR